MKNFCLIWEHRLGRVKEKPHVDGVERETVILVCEQFKQDILIRVLRLGVVVLEPVECRGYLLSGQKTGQNHLVGGHNCTSLRHLRFFVTGSSHTYNNIKKHLIQ